MVKSKVEVFKSYFQLNQKRILFYELKHPDGVSKDVRVSMKSMTMSGTIL